MCNLPRRLPVNEQPKKEEALNSNGFWIGLKRNKIGEVQWTNEQSLMEYEAQKLRKMDIFPEKGECVQWNSVGVSTELASLFLKNPFLAMGLRKMFGKSPFCLHSPTRF